MACKMKPNTPIKTVLGSCLPNDAPPKVQNLTVGQLWKIGGFIHKGDPPKSQDPNLNLSPAEKKVLADAFICYIERTDGQDQGEPKGDWSYDLNYMSVCCCCTT